MLRDMDLQALNGKRFALWLTDEKDESVVFGGIVRWDGHTLLLDRDKKRSFEIREEWYERIKPVPDSVKKILLNTELFLRLFVGDLPLGEDESKFQNTGLQWPATDD